MFNLPLRFLTVFTIDVVFAVFNKVRIELIVSSLHLFYILVHCVSNAWQCLFCEYVHSMQVIKNKWNKFTSKGNMHQQNKTKVYITSGFRLGRGPLPSPM